MEFLKFKTSFSIPIQVMRSRVNYTEVKQASGIQYILLALINKSSVELYPDNTIDENMFWSRLYESMLNAYLKYMEVD